jgi:hypothetical protein
MHASKLICLGLLSVLSIGCVSQTGLYQWGNYEGRLYKYYKSPTAANAYMTELAEIIDETGDQKKVAPGIYAEYGYMLRKAGREKEAIAMFEKEQNAWPESQILMQRLIHAGDKNAYTPNT